MSKHSQEESILFAMGKILSELEKNTNESLAQVVVLMNAYLKPFTADIDTSKMNREDPSFKEIVEEFLGEVSIYLSKGDEKIIASHKVGALKAAKYYFEQFKNKLKNEQ